MNGKSIAQKARRAIALKTGEGEMRQFFLFKKTNEEQSVKKKI